MSNAFHASLRLLKAGISGGFSRSSLSALYLFSFKASLLARDLNLFFLASITNCSSPLVMQNWCNWECKPTSFVGPVPSPQQVASLLVHASPSLHVFRVPASFVPGQSLMGNFTTT